MSARVVIISPELPPVCGGLADYTRIVASYWPPNADLQFIVPRQANISYPDLLDHPVNEVSRDARDLTSHLPSGDGSVLLHYSAYGYDRLGYPRWLIFSLIEWKQKTRGRLCVMFHEIWTFWPWWNKNFAIQFFHRRAIGRLLKVADAVFTTTASQAKYLAALHHGTEIRVLPVGANVLPEVEGTSAPERGTAVIFGTQPTRLKALALMKDDLQRLAKSNRITTITAAGAGNTETGSAAERALLESIGLTSGFQQAGSRSAAEISRLLSCAEFGLAAQDRLSCTKSGTFMAYAAHALNVLSPYAERAGPEPMSLLVHPTELSGSITDAELRDRAAKLRAWYERTASWPQIAQAFAQALRLEEKRHAAP